MNFKKPNFLPSANAVTAISGNTSGAIWGDFDNDGDDDLIFMPIEFFSGISFVPQLYRNDGAGVFTSVNGGFEASTYVGGTIGDYDNDGNLDIYLSVGVGENKLYKGQGNLSFTKITGLAVSITSTGGSDNSSYNPTWTDFNNDGRLDLFIPYSDKPSLLFKQNGDGTFTKETSGELVTATFFGPDASWVDFDNDGDMDVFLVNGRDGNNSIYYPSLLYKNNGDGTFTKLASPGFDISSSIYNPFSSAWGDYNNDGFLDVFVANEESQVGSTNYLYKNNGNGTFTKQVSSLVMEVQTVPSYAGSWGDINNDGLLDLLVSKRGGNVIYLNQGATFTKVTTEKFNDTKTWNLGMALSDFNSDGKLDLAAGTINPALFNNNGQSTSTLPNAMFENNNAAGNWLEVKLIGKTTNRSALGARVKVRTGVSTDQYRQVMSHTSFGSQNSFTLHFGLGGSTSVTFVEVSWPSGLIQTLQSPGTNKVITIVEDNAGPVVSSTTPVSDAVGVNSPSTIAITLNETATAIAGKNLSVYKASDLATPVFRIDVSAATMAVNTFTSHFHKAWNLLNATMLPLKRGHSKMFMEMPH